MACHGSMDLAERSKSWPTSLPGFERNFLLVPLVRSRENRERRGVVLEIGCIVEIAASRALRG